MPHALAAAGRKKPNFVIIFLDDSGWADFHPSAIPRTPRQMSRAGQPGCRFNTFYVPQASAPRLRALLSGSYPGRTGVRTHPPDQGLEPRFATMGEVSRPLDTGPLSSQMESAITGHAPPARGFDIGRPAVLQRHVGVHPEHRSLQHSRSTFGRTAEIKIERSPKIPAHADDVVHEHAVDFIAGISTILPAVRSPLMPKCAVLQ
jgi:hypothetical protein